MRNYCQRCGNPCDVSDGPDDQLMLCHTCVAYEGQPVRGATVSEPKEIALLEDVQRLEGRIDSLSRVLDERLRRRAEDLKELESSIDQAVNHIRRNEEGIRELAMQVMALRNTLNARTEHLA
jgi:hypothetical protein